MALSDRMRGNVPVLLDGRRMSVPDWTTPEEIMGIIGIDPQRRELVIRKENGYVEQQPKGRRIRIIANMELNIQILGEDG